MTEVREMSMSGNGMFARRSPANGSRADKRRVLDQMRETPHDARKIYHFVMGAICFALYAVVLPEKAALWTLGLVGGTWIVLDLLRLRWPWLQALALKYFGKVMRREELRTLSANSWYVLGLLGAGLLFPKPYAMMGLAFLAVGDPVAAMVGTRYGRVPLWHGKSLEGTLANGLVSAGVAGAIAHFLLGLPLADALLVGILGGSTSAIAEAAPWPVNDNLAIPVASAGLLWAVLTLVGLPLGL